MIRLMLRFSFWAILASTLLPGLRHADVFKDGVNTDTLGQAIELTKADLASLCVRNPSACEAAQSGLSVFANQAKAGALAAYHGIRTQFDAPDSAVKTGGIQKN